MLYDTACLALVRTNSLCTLVAVQGLGWFGAGFGGSDHVSGPFKWHSTSHVSHTTLHYNSEMQLSHKGCTSRGSAAPLAGRRTGLLPSPRNGSARTAAAHASPPSASEPASSASTSSTSGQASGSKLHPAAISEHLQDYEHVVSPSQFRQLGYQVVDWMAAYMEGMDQRQRVRPDIQVGPMHAR